MSRRLGRVVVFLLMLTVFALLPDRWAHIVPCLVGLVASMLIWAGQSILRSYKRQVGGSWAATMGTVESTIVKADAREDGLLSPYELEIAYSYRANGEWYSGFESRRFERESEADQAGRSLRGQSVFVRYDPQHPEESLVDWMAPAGNVQAYWNPARRA